MDCGSGFSSEALGVVSWKSSIGCQLGSTSHAWGGTGITPQKTPDTLIVDLRTDRGLNKQLFGLRPVLPLQPSGWVLVDDVPRPAHTNKNKLYLSALSVAWTNDACPCCRATSWHSAAHASSSGQVERKMKSKPQHVSACIHELRISHQLAF